MQEVPKRRSDAATKGWRGRSIFATIALLALLGAGSAGPHGAVDTGQVTLSTNEIRRILQHSPLGEPPADTTNAFADDPRAARLGQILFFDTRLSAGGEVSCATCHDPELSFADGKTVAEGHGVGPRNTPALWNVAWNRWFFWDGHADTLWSQAIQPLEADVEMASNRLAIAHLVHDDRKLRRDYEAVFGPMPDLDDRDRFPDAGRPLPAHADHPHQLAWSGMTDPDRRAVDRVMANLGKAMAAYQRLLVSRDAPFDRFAAGLRERDPSKLTALSPAAQRGLKLFVGEANCRLCHSGPNFSDGEFHNIGVPPSGGGLPLDAGRYRGLQVLAEDPFRADGAFSDDPQGRVARRSRVVANTPDNWGRFKTPSLRNAARTAPYMHQGQFATLEDVLRFYSTLEGAVQLDHHREQVLQPLDLTDRQVADLLAFIESLTGRPLPDHLTTAPQRRTLE